MDVSDQGVAVINAAKRDTIAAVATFLGWVLTAALVAGVIFAVVVAVTGRADVMADMPPDAVPLGLPADRPMRAEDVHDVRLDLAFRGYRMDQVDAVLERLADDLATRDREIEQLRARAPEQS